MIRWFDYMIIAPFAYVLSKSFIIGAYDFTVISYLLYVVYCVKRKSWEGKKV